MQQRRRLAIVIVAVVALAAPAASASETNSATGAPTKRTERVYFHCAGTNKVQNTETTTPSWNTMAPTQSFQTGGGCGHYGNLLEVIPTPLRHVIWNGTFTGNLDALTAELHNIHASSDRATADIRLAVELTIDGHISYTHPVSSPTATPRAAGGTALADKLLISFQGLGLVSEEGDGTQVHEVTLEVGVYNEIQSVWVWDATEMAAGITFNPSAPLEGKVLQADPYPVG